MTRRLLFVVLSLCCAAAAQTQTDPPPAAATQACQLLSGPLFSLTPTIDGTHLCNQGPQTSDAGNTVTYSDVVFHDTVIGDVTSVSPNTVFMDVYSKPQSNTGACYFKPVQRDPKNGRFIAPAQSMNCLPIAQNNITAAQDTNDFNRFIAQVYRQFIVNGPGGFNPDFSKCSKPDFVQNLVQWPGIACAPPKKAQCDNCDPPPDPCQGGTPSVSGLQDGDPNENVPTGCLPSPIIIDVDGEGFHMTSAANGVMFDISGTGNPISMGWTAAGHRNAFLALPGADGLVHNGKELFGNFTPQPKSAHPNGFLALAEYDKPENGGNSDGMIDEHDAVFSRLRLWIDADHDGISQPNELHTLEELGVHSLSIDYKASRRTDEFGNQFRYRAGVNPGAKREPQDKTASGEPGRWGWDVFFTVK